MSVFMSISVPNNTRFCINSTFSAVSFFFLKSNFFDTSTLKIIINQCYLFHHCRCHTIDNAEYSDFFPLHSCDDSSEPVPSTSSEPVDMRLPAQEGKQTSQESASTTTSERLKSNQAPMKDVDCHGGPQT